MVDKAHEGQVVFRRIASVAVEVSNLAMLLRQVAIEFEAESASPCTLGKDGCFDSCRDSFPGLLFGDHRFLYFTGAAEKPTGQYKMDHERTLGVTKGESESLAAVGLFNSQSLTVRL
jgi:hypothetical protein